MRFPALRFEENIRRIVADPLRFYASDAAVVLRALREAIAKLDSEREDESRGDDSDREERECF